MPFEDLFTKYEVKNTELKGLAEFCHEAAVNTAKEQSASLAIGLDMHAVVRQENWLAVAKLRAKALADHPIPDLPATHPMMLTCDLSVVPQFPLDSDGRVINGDCEQMMVAWMRVAVELLRSNSAGLGGGMLGFDIKRLNSNLDAIGQLLPGLSIEESGEVDFPETAHPEAVPGPRKK
jgi:hypothetical protein